MTTTTPSIAATLAKLAAELAAAEDEPPASQAQPAPQLSDRVMTAPEVAAYLHLDLSTTYRLAKRGELPAFRISGRVRFLASEIEAYVRQQRAAAQERADLAPFAYGIEG